MLTPARMDLDRMTLAYRDAMATETRLREAWEVAVATWFPEIAVQCLWERPHPEDLRCSTPPQGVVDALRQISPHEDGFSSTLHSKSPREGAGASNLSLRVWLGPGKTEIELLAEEDPPIDAEGRGVTALSEFIQDRGLRVISPDLVHRLNQAETAVEQAAAALRSQQGVLERATHLGSGGPSGDALMKLDPEHVQRVQSAFAHLRLCDAALGEAEEMVVNALRRALLPVLLEGTWTRQGTTELRLARPAVDELREALALPDLYACEVRVDPEDRAGSITLCLRSREITLTGQPDLLNQYVQAQGLTVGPIEWTALQVAESQVATARATLHAAEAHLQRVRNAALSQMQKPR